MRKIIIMLIAIAIMCIYGYGKDVKPAQKDVKTKGVNVVKKEKKAEASQNKGKKKSAAKEKNDKPNHKRQIIHLKYAHIELSKFVDAIEKSYTPVEQGGYEATAEVFRKAGISPSMSINEIAAKAVKNASEIKREPYREGGEMVIYDWYINVDSLFGSPLFNFMIEVEVIDDRASGVGITSSITLYKSHETNTESAMLSVRFEDLDDWVVDNPDEIGYSNKNKEGVKKLNEFIRAFKVPVRMNESTVVNMLVVSTPDSNYVIYPKNIDDPAQGVAVVEIPEGWIGTIAVRSAMNDGPKFYGYFGIISTGSDVLAFLEEHRNGIKGDNYIGGFVYCNIKFELDESTGKIKYIDYVNTMFVMDDDKFSNSKARKK